MTKLMGSNCGAKNVSCESIMGFGFKIDVKFGFLNTTTYKKDNIKRVIALKEGKDLDEHRMMMTGGILGGGLAGGIGYSIGAAMMHSKKNVYEVEFDDGKIVALMEKDSSHQKNLDQLIIATRY